MFRKLFGMGLSDAEKQRLGEERLSNLKDYINKNEVVVASDSGNTFEKCDLEKNNKL
jgi:hypothetical protein